MRGYRSEQQVLPGSVAWANLGKDKWWSVRNQDPSEAPELIQTLRKTDQILVRLFDNWGSGAKDPAVRQYRWLKTASIRNFQEDFGSKSVAISSAIFKQHVQIALGYCKGFNPVAWVALPVGDGAGITFPKDETSSGVGGVARAVPAVDVDLPRVDEDRYVPIIIEETPTERQGSTASLGDGLDQGAENTDDQYFREQQSISEKNSRKLIKMRLPAVRLVDTGVPEEVAKLENYLHELLGHFGWGLIKEALPFLVEEDLVKYLKKVTSLPSTSHAVSVLAGTLDFTVKWMSSALAEEQGSDNRIIGAVDASFAMDAMTRKSHGVFINFVNNEPTGQSAGKAGCKASLL